MIPFPTIARTPVVMALAASIVSAVDEQQKPDVLVVPVDDFGWYDVGYNGSTFYETPEINSTLTTKS